MSRSRYVVDKDSFLRDTHRVTIVCTARIPRAIRRRSAHDAAPPTSG